MPLTPVPSRGNGLPKLLGQFPCLTPIVIQVVGTNTLYLAETSIQLMSITDDGVVDALAIVQANSPFVFWAIGDVWIAGSQASGVTFKPFIFVPGVVSSSGIVGIGAYGIGPSVPPSPPPNVQGGLL